MSNLQVSGQVVHLNLENEMGRRASKGQRWTLTCGEDIKRAKKPAHLAEVIEHLGPFKFESEAEALQAGHTAMLGDEVCGLSKELAKKLIEDIAVCFNAEEHLSGEAPRFGDLLDRLTAAKDRLLATADELESLDDICRYELLRGDLVAEPSRLLNDTRAHRQFLELIGHLRKMALHVDRVRDQLLERRKRQKRSLIDRGGDTNVWNEQMGSPRWGLVNGAVQIFEMFKPGEATGTERGAFHEFVNDIFEYATGEEGTKYAKLETWIKVLAKAYREERKLESEAKRLDIEWNKLTDQDPKCANVVVQKKRQGIIAEEKRVRQRRHKLWQVMWLHLRLQDDPKPKIRRVRHLPLRYSVKIVRVTKPQCGR